MKGVGGNLIFNGIGLESQLTFLFTEQDLQMEPEYLKSISKGPLLQRQYVGDCIVFMGSNFMLSRNPTH